MCPCTCHTEPSPTGVPYAGCSDCAHLHTAEELAGATLAPATAATVDGTKDGRGAADNDQPYTWGRMPSVTWPFPFTQAQMAKMLGFKSRLGDERRELKNRRPEEAA